MKKQAPMLLADIDLVWTDRMKNRLKKDKNILRNNLVVLTKINNQNLRI